jgi:hypothetical protein
MLLVRLYKDLTGTQKAPGIPEDWPAEISEVSDDTPDPKDGRLVMKDVAELEAYKEDKKKAYDTWQEELFLPQVKSDKFDKIDIRTQELISEGFEFSLKRFSLSAAAQNNFTSLYTIRDTVEYPVKINTIDDLDTHLLADATAVSDFYLAAIDTLRTLLDAGTALKDQVRAASNTAEVDAVNDTR